MKNRKPSYDDFKDRPSEGLMFTYSGSIGKSFIMNKKQMIEAGGLAKCNYENYFVYCERCSTTMNYILRNDDEKYLSTGIYVCPVCNVRVDEEELYSQLDSEQLDYDNYYPAVINLDDEEL